jgi:hypothetical protein
LSYALQLFPSSRPSSPSPPYTSSSSLISPLLHWFSAIYAICHCSSLLSHDGVYLEVRLVTIYVRYNINRYNLMLICTLLIRFWSLMQPSITVLGVPSVETVFALASVFFHQISTGSTALLSSLHVASSCWLTHFHILILYRYIDIDQDMAYTKLDTVSNWTQLYRHYAQLELLQIIRFDSGLRLEIFARPEYWAILLESSLKLFRSAVKTVQLNKDQSS